MIIGVISDTHGLVRPSVAEVLDGVALILHAGDIGGPHILAKLSEIAPVQAVSGNVDPPDMPGVPREIRREIEGLRIHVSHGHELGPPTVERLLAAYDDDVLIYGHTHRALIQRVGQRWVVNPGAAGPRRFDLIPSVARLTMREGNVAGVQIITLA
jgi:putative phosphoesterase